MHLPSLVQPSIVRVALLGLVLGPAIGCNTSSVVAPAQSTITLTSANSVITLNGSTTITAFVGDQNGTPVRDGTIVNFQTTLGTIQPLQTRTNTGRATATLGGVKQAGTASITASSGSIVAPAATVTVINPLGVAITPDPATAAVDTIVTFTLTVTPASGAPAVDHYEWDFGDSKTATTSTGKTTHVYATAGTMTVKVTAKVVDGSSSVGQIDIIITR